MVESATSRGDQNKLMLGFILRRCAVELGHAPTPDEFAAWANEQKQNGKSFCLFGKAITSSAAKVMFSQPGRMVTVSPQGMARIWQGNR